jgi:hypothetical protein
MSTTDILSLILVGALALTVFLWWRIPEPREPLFRRAGLLFGLALALEMGGMITRQWCWNNTPVYNVFQLVEFILLLVLLTTAVPGLRTAALVVGVAGAFAFGASLLRQGGWTLLATDAILVFGILLSLGLMRALFLLAKDSDVPLQRLPVFWLFMGCLVYFGGLVPTLGGIRLLYERDIALAADLWAVVPILAIVRYLLAAWACLLAARNNRG